eukprot:334533-Rhodomonas_salina.2
MFSEIHSVTDGSTEKPLATASRMAVASSSQKNTSASSDDLQLVLTVSKSAIAWSKRGTRCEAGWLRDWLSDWLSDCSSPSGRLGLVDIAMVADTAPMNPCCLYLRIGWDRSFLM